MENPEKNDKIIGENVLNLKTVTDQLITTGSLNLSSQADAELERKNKEKDKQLELEQKRINFWVKDIAVFLLFLLTVFLIDIYAFIILQTENSSETEIRFAIAVLTTTVSSLLAYLLGRSSK